jgi:hypothetical protein
MTKKAITTGRSTDEVVKTAKFDLICNGGTHEKRKKTIRFEPLCSQKLCTQLTFSDSRIQMEQYFVDSETTAIYKQSEKFEKQIST